MNNPNAQPHKISYTEESGVQLFKPFAAARLAATQGALHRSRPVYVVTYADDSHGVRGGHYDQMQKQILRDIQRCESVRSLAFNFADLATTEEYKRDPHYFTLHPFANGHAFKPVILRKALDLIEDGDYLMYYDCSRYALANTIPLLVALCDANQGGLTWQYGDPNSMWVKKGVYEACGDMTCATANSPHLASTWFVFRVDSCFRKFTQSWAELNCRKEIAEERHYSHVTSSDSRSDEFSSYVENRGDQSIFSVLAAMHGYTGFFGAGYGFNRSPKLFLTSMWTGSAIFKKWHALKMSLRSRTT
jgi:hypothetical protein